MNNEVKKILTIAFLVQLLFNLYLEKFIQF